MDERIVSELYKPFDLKEREGLGGMTFKYVASNDIIDRMNRLFEGCWSTMVMSQERIEDSVLVRVKVMVYDKVTAQSYEHEGYGSGRIMRYASGNKKGETIDIGNAYKSAEAKAIKHACSRWGAALYLENEDAFEIEDLKGSKSENTPFPFGNEGDEQKGEVSVPSPERSFSPPPDLTGKSTSNKTNEVPDIPPFAPKTPDDEDKEEVSSGNLKTNDVAITNDQESELKISDVQKVALQSLLKLKKLKFEDLVTEALSGADTLPSSPEDLTYQEAVTIIKYGNDMTKK